jgi:MFS family permease
MHYVSGGEEFRSYGYRWVVLLVFGLVLCFQAFLWISFAPIESSVERVLGVSETLVRLLALVGPVMFVFLGSYAGDLSDRRGFKFAVSLGAVIISVFGIIRAIVPHVVDSGTAQYWIMLFCQAAIGSGAVFILVNMSKMPIKWFREESRAMAIGLATLFFYLGTAIGLPLVNALAGIPEGTTDVAVISAGVNRILWVTAAIMVVGTIIFMLFSKENPPTPSGPLPDEAKLGTWEALKRFMGLPTFRALAFVSLVGYGVYVGLTVTMEKIIGYHGFSSSFATIIASGITVGGIVGAATIPGISEKVGLRKPFLILASLVILPMGLIIGFVGIKALDVIGALLLGIFLLPALPVTFTVVGEMEDIGPLYAGAAVGTLMAIGNVGSLLIPLGMELFKREAAAGATDYRLSIVFLGVLGVLGLIAVILWVRETGPRTRMEARGQL